MGQIIARQVITIYFANKLRRFPYASAAIAMLFQKYEKKIEFKFGDDVLIFMNDIITLQYFLMFYHEASHLYYGERPEKLRDSKDAMLKLFKDTRNSYQQLYPDLMQKRPEFATNINGKFLNHFIEEMVCDYQALFSTAGELSKINPNQDILADLRLASELLAKQEYMLKHGFLVMLEIAKNTDGFLKINPKMLDLLNFTEMHGAIQIRKWNTILAFQEILKRIGNVQNIDAFEWQEFIFEKHTPMLDIFDECVLKELNNFFSAKYFSKVFARAKMLKYDEDLSKRDARSLTNELLGW